jgi:hypothetical protein
MSEIKLQGVGMSVEAATNVAEAGVDVAADVMAIRSGTLTGETLLSECLDGADDDRIHGWRDYVSSVVIAAGKV